MAKSLAYLFPDIDEVLNYKIFQDVASKIKAFYFTRDKIQDALLLEFANNGAIYFLFDNISDKVYVGQSINGIKRIEDHIRKKDFWSHCILFVTDNNSFNKADIDYMEYFFINKISNSRYTLVNQDMRLAEPSVSIYNKPNLISYVKEIEFLLNAEGVNLDGAIDRLKSEVIFLSQDM